MNEHCHDGEKSVNNIPAFQTNIGDGVLDTQYYLYDMYPYL